MRIHLTNGKVSVTNIICATRDIRDHQAVMASSRPASKAVEIVKRRMSIDLGVSMGIYDNGKPVPQDIGNWWPIAGVAVEGIPA